VHLIILFYTPILGRYILYTLCTDRLIGDLMGTIGQLFPLADNTDGAAVEQVQQQHHFKW
jgi:hypothetical protein